MLGSYADAEDIIQDAFLRFDTSLETANVRDDRRFLRAIVTRLCLDRLRSAQQRRVEYIGPWLPEFVVADSNEPAADIAFSG